MKTFLVVFGFVSVSLGSNFAAHAQNQDQVRPRSVTVSGSCIRSTLPDRGAVVLTADFLEKEMPVAAKKAMDDYEKLKKSIQALKLKDMEFSTTESSFREERQWQKDREVFKGYRARMGLRVSTSETSRLGEVISVAAKQGIRDVGSLIMYISPEKLQVERETCLADAVRNAKAKADAIAKAASAKVGRVLYVDEMGSVNPPPRPPMMMKAQLMEASADMASSAPQIDAAMEKIMVDIQVSYALD